VIVLSALLTKTRRSLVFIAANLVLALALLVLLIIPIATAYVERTDQIAEQRQQLARIRSLQQRSSPSGHPPADAVGMLLPGADEGASSAALQSDLKMIVAAAGAQFVAVRGLDPTRLADASLVTAMVEVRGSIHAVRGVVRAIEDHKPALLINSTSLRGVSADQDGELHAEFTVQGVMQRAAVNSRDPKEEGGRGR
jgi:hypothetical protein